MLQISDGILKENKRFKTTLAIDSASLQLFSSCQNRYRISAQLATPLKADRRARNGDFDGDRKQAIEIADKY
ncbi:hypothetical protein RsS62_50610 [Rhizobium dioscoreae]|uniref:Uncharacterized protein n=1 Tax=Rhizobium dioscoreae TaxID=2653122 RepID=A0ABQ0YYK3_9HYPH|nr:MULTISPECIES: hypothetical protein [Rhizobium]MCZ3377389.1 hypothetical protein [Rhizobium sp. AG207R]GES45809.1 hypothetical protein RsS62_50610 [Rhizobium dioscoreae]GES48172.1 hypothetical protein RsS93_07860 [Rhizobium dioscoreae]GLU79359.1 hypothetical protein Rhsp01_05350 [Rhizobium sp. NBRC 114257]